VGTTDDLLIRGAPAPRASRRGPVRPWAGGLGALPAVASVLLAAGCGRTAALPEGSVLWLRADAGVEVGYAGAVERPGMPDDRTPVEAWRDGSGRGHDAAPVPFPPGIRRSADPPDRRPLFRAGEAGIWGRPALAFDGVDDLLGIADAEDLNTGGPYGQRTILLVLRTGRDVERRQMVFETGGDLRGFNVYFDGGRLYLGAFDAWNDDGGRTTPFGPVNVSVPVRPETDYRIAFVFDQRAGTLSGYVDGRKFGEAGGVGLVFLHHEDIGIGAIDEDTYYHDGVRQGVPTGDFFDGRIAEIILYNEALSGRRLRAADAYLRRRYGGS